MRSEVEKYKLFENGGLVKDNLNLVISHLAVMMGKYRYLRLSSRIHEII